MRRSNFGDEKIVFGTNLRILNVGLMILWKSKMAGDGGNKKIFQCCTDVSGQEILDFRALQGHPGGNLVDPSLQDNELIPNDFFEYIYHIGCAISLHSITNSGLTAGGWIPWTRSTEIRTSLTWSNCVLHGTSRKRGTDTKTQCIGSMYNLLNGKVLSSIQHDRTQSSFTTHSQLVVSRKLLWWNLEK